MWRMGSGNRAEPNVERAYVPSRGIASRKADHVRINLQEDVAAKGVDSGFDNYHFLHCALPEIDLDQVDPATVMFGRRLAFPLLISCCQHLLSC